MSWDGDAIFFGQGGKGIMRVSANGGKPEMVASVKAGELAHGPQLLARRADAVVHARDGRQRRSMGQGADRRAVVEVARAEDAC